MKSSDGKMRGAQVSITHDQKHVKINRPINKLIRLETDGNNNDVMDNPNDLISDEQHLKFINDKNIVFS